MWKLEKLVYITFPWSQSTYKKPRGSVAHSRVIFFFFFYNIANPYRKIPELSCSVKLASDMGSLVGSAICNLCVCCRFLKFKLNSSCIQWGAIKVVIILGIRMCQILWNELIPLRIPNNFWINIKYCFIKHTFKLMTATTKSCPKFFSPTK